jgi:putative hydrolase of the HAD superfamily
VFPAEDLGVAKPQPAVYAAMCRRPDVIPGSVLHVGDLYELDVTAARSAGLHVVHLDRHDEGPGEELCRITTLSALGGPLRA